MSVLTLRRRLLVAFVAGLVIAVAAPVETSATPTPAAAGPAASCPLALAPGTTV